MSRHLLDGLGGFLLTDEDDFLIAQDEEEPPPPGTPTDAVVRHRGRAIHVWSPGNWAYK